MAFLRKDCRFEDVDSDKKLKRAISLKVLE